ncbi:hypothetical protein YPPY100_3483, partial [Yersinia pestis PY-100]
MLLPVIMAGG